MGSEWAVRDIGQRVRGCDVRWADERSGDAFECGGDDSGEQYGDAGCVAGVREHAGVHVLGGVQRQPDVHVWSEWAVRDIGQRVRGCDVRWADECSGDAFECGGDDSGEQHGDAGGVPGIREHTGVHVLGGVHEHSHFYM